MPLSLSGLVVFMLLWALLLVLTPVNGQYERIPRSVINSHPRWTTFFQGEKVTLACYRFGFYVPQKTKWYRPGKKPWEIQGNTMEIHEPGEYRCQADGAPVSISVRLDFSKASLVLQAPFAVFEGDPLDIRCYAKENTASRTLKLFKNNKPMTLQDQRAELHIHHAAPRNNGEYHCTQQKFCCTSTSSNTVKIQVQELFPRPVLAFIPSYPVDGGPVTLICKTQLSAQKSDVKLQFCFFRDSQALGPGCSNSSELHIPAIWTEESKWYQCKAEAVTSSIQKASPEYSIPVQSVSPYFQIQTVPDSELMFEGHSLIFTCSVSGLPGPIKFSWYKRIKLNKETKIHKSSEAEFKISTVSSSDAGEYYCEASNRRRSFVSRPVTITIKVPVSQPVLTLSTAEAQALEGGLVTLRCKSQRGSPRILYEFYHEDALLRSWSIFSGSEESFSFFMTTEHSGNYYCTADNGLGAQRSEAVRLFVIVPVSHPILTLRVPETQVAVGDMVELHCEALRGSPPILYQFYHENVILGSSSAPSREKGSFNFSVTAEHSGNYFCEADNGQGPQRSSTVTLNVAVPVSHPILTLRIPGAQAVAGDMVELHCETVGGSPPIQYHFYHEDINVGSSLAPSGGGISINFFLTVEHSGNYSCEAENVLGAQHSEVITIRVRVPVSRPVLTLGTPTAQAVVGDLVELHCEALRGSLPILYQFYHENVTLGNSSATSTGGVSFNLSLTAEHFGNYSCAADNGLGAQHSEKVTLFITGMTENRSGPLATGVAGGLSIAAGAVLFYCWLSRKAGGRPAFRDSRSPSDSEPQEPTYHNVPAWIELQPIYSNDPKREDVIYSEVWSIQQKHTPAVASGPRVPMDKGSSVIYSQVKVASTPAFRLQQLASSAPHR